MAFSVDVAVSFILVTCTGAISQLSEHSKLALHGKHVLRLPDLDDLPDYRALDTFGKNLHRKSLEASNKEEVKKAREEVRERFGNTAKVKPDVKPPDLETLNEEIARSTEEVHSTAEAGYSSGARTIQRTPDLARVQPTKEVERKIQRTPDLARVRPIKEVEDSPGEESETSVKTEPKGVLKTKPSRVRENAAETSTSGEPSSESKLKGGKYDRAMMEEIARSESDEIPHSYDYVKDSKAPPPPQSAAQRAGGGPANTRVLNCVALATVVWGVVAVGLAL
mmetsp:Transcript_137354/g.242733  ORF Transcript_137354/g.242733 Transcript_137354/m.242733 type:complete len:280 (-) Transcript_137354:25-864(-)